MTVRPLTEAQETTLIAFYRSARTEDDQAALIDWFVAEVDRLRAVLAATEQERDRVLLDLETEAALRRTAFSENLAVAARVRVLEQERDEWMMKCGLSGIRVRVLEEALEQIAGGYPINGTRARSIARAALDRESV